MRRFSACRRGGGVKYYFFLRIGGIFVPLPAKWARNCYAMTKSNLFWLIFFRKIIFCISDEMFLNLNISFLRHFVPRRKNVLLIIEWFSPVWDKDDFRFCNKYDFEWNRNKYNKWIKIYWKVALVNEKIFVFWLIINNKIFYLNKNISYFQRFSSKFTFPHNEKFSSKKNGQFSRSLFAIL